MAGHAYLHVSYDLPIVISQSLQASHLHSQARASQIYMALESGFKAATRSAWNKPLLVKFLLWTPLQFDPVFLGWLIQLRNAAWIHAVYLANVSEDERPAAKISLHRDIEERLRRALQQFWPWS
jgi:hypothetical protein